MEPKKYWWMSYEIDWIDGPSTRDDKVVDVHPFIEITKISDSKPLAGCILISWQLIDAEQYNLWNELNNK